MTGLLVHVEGETEETFINEVLRDHLYHFGFDRVSARLLGNARQRSRRGGIRSWPTVRKDIAAHLWEDRSCIATTMVDYYALPGTGEGAWPGRHASAALPFADKAPRLESAILEAFVYEMGPNFDTRRFVPFVMMHEFEGLLFSDCAAFARGVGNASLEQAFQLIRDQFDTPEEINDSPLTAPSKRIESLISGYEKPIYGVTAILEIGLTNIRAACPHFNNWLSHLETLGQALA